MTIEEILAGESKNVEFKENLPEKSIKYMKSVVAFANGTGGKIIFGIADQTREVVGFDKEDVFKKMDAIANAVSDSCEPAIIPDISLQTIDGKTVIVAEIPEGRQRPYYIKALGREGGVYVRVAGTTRLADEYMVRELMFEGSNRYFDQALCSGLTITDEEIDAACRIACADEFIQKMPDKYNTHIEQGGSNVSGGQKQRLCIARALLKKPKILILDDSTSAVDTATDAKIRKAFLTEIPETTKLIIAQRISSVQDADRIIVMENGKVNGFGSHEELLKTNEIYREVYESQTGGGGDFDEKRGE